MKIRQLILHIAFCFFAVLVTLLLYAQFSKQSFLLAARSLPVLWLLVGSFLTAGAVFALELFEKQREKKLLRILTKKLIEVTQNKRTGHVIISRKSTLFALGQAVNNVQSMTQNLSTDYTRQQRGYFGLLEYVPIGVMVIDQEREIYLSNHYLSEIMGRELDFRHEIYYTPLAEFDLVKIIEETFRTKEDQQTEVKLSLPSGMKILSVNVIYIPVSSHHFFVMLLVNDITEQKKIERMQNDFVSNVSHELKTPVTSITGFSETLQNGAIDDPDAAQKFVSIIHQESLRLTDLINDILSLSRIGPDTQLKLADIHMADFVNEDLKAFDSSIKERSLQIDNKIPANMIIVSDASKLNHIISNLIQNAIRYNKEAGEIQINAVKDQNEWTFTISDTGIGMTDDQRARIFERFYRADTSRSREVDGTGLGLAIVKEYVDLLSGDISVESQLKVGTSFTVTFPLVQKNKVHP